MRANVIMPQMGESIAEGTITKWLKKEGDPVKRDEPLFEISTDKVDSEIPASTAGTLVEIRAQEGDTVEVNTVVAVIETDAAAGADAPPPARPAAAPPAAPGPVPAPAPRPPAPKPPQPIAAPAPPPPPQQAATGTADAREVRSSPLVRRMAREHGLDLTRIPGTGRGGRVSKQDVLSFLDGRTALPTAPPVPSPVPAPSAAATTGKVAPGSGDAIEVIPMSNMRRSIAEHMVNSRRTSAHVATVFEVDMTPIARQRDGAKDEFARRYGTKLTFMPFIFKALVGAIRDFPLVNASIREQSILVKKEINLGMAVAVAEGLIVPVLKRAEELSLVGLARQANDLAERARSKKLLPDDVQGGTFTVTNPGVYGGLFGTPIINQPQVAILGVGGIEKRPVVIDDAIAIRSMCYLALSFDHRLIDGAYADQFMAALKARLQGWSESPL